MPGVAVGSRWRQRLSGTISRSWETADHNYSELKQGVMVRDGTTEVRYVDGVMIGIRTASNQVVGSSNLSGRAKMHKKLNHLAVLELFWFWGVVPWRGTVIV